MMLEHVAIFDLETTGVDLNKDQSLQLACVVITFKEDGTITDPRVLFNSLGRPSVPIQSEAQEVHGIGEGMVAWAPPSDWTVMNFALMLDALASTGDVILAGHNVEKFDINMIKRQCPTADFGKFAVIDTYTMAIRNFPAMQHRLTDFYEWYVKGVEVKAHDAAADCYMCACILAKFMEENKFTPAHLAGLLHDPKVLDVMPFGKYKGVDIPDVPISYWRWCSANWDDVHKDLAITMATVLGEEVACLGRR